MEKQKDESYISYIKRITNQCKDKKITYSEWGDYILGDENVYSDDNCRKGFYIVRKVLDRIDDNCEVTDVAIQLELDKLKDELYKERCKLSDERRLKNKDLRVEARYENLVEVMKETMEFMTPIELKKCDRKIVDGIEANLDLSDIHAGILIDNTLRYFDIDVIIEQFETLKSKTLKYCKLNNVETLHISLIGDLISGIIQINNRIDEEEDTMTQIIKISEILSQFINDIKGEIPKVKVYGVIGNHSSAFANKKERTNKENFERLIFEFIKLRTNTKVITNGVEDYVMYKIGDREILATHGNRDSVVNIKQHFVDLLGKTFDEYHIGHYHHFAIKEDCGVEIICNSSFVSTDDFAVSIRKNSKPSQTLRIYDEDIATYKITLE